MKSAIALTFLLALCTAAAAKLAPVERTMTSSLVAEDSVMYPGPIGAMLESAYFRAPQQAQAAASNRIFPCHLRLYFSKEPMTFTQSCE
jgi:hypothetical protein